MAGCPICEDLHHGASRCPFSLVGKTLGKYVVTDFLAAGGMGAVYRGKHESLGSPVAVKTVHRALLPQNAKTPQRQQLAETMVKRFTDEAKRAASLRHPNIVRVEDLGVAPDGTPYLAMEFLEGVSFKELLETSGPLTSGRAAELVTHALGALEFAHQRNIIHRDIKPDNLYLQHPGEETEAVKVLDFGIAKAVGDGATRLGLTQTGHGAMGTFYYMSPEQATDPRKVTARSDVFSVGASLYELLTGCNVLFEIERELTDSGMLAVQFLHGVLAAIMEGRIARHPRRVRPEIPEWLDAIVARSLAHDPAARFSSAGEMAAALHAGAAEAPAPAPANPAAFAATAPSHEMAAQAGPKSIPKTEVAPKPLGSTTNEWAGQRVVPVSQPEPLAHAAKSKSPMLALAIGGVALVAVAGLSIALLAGGGSGAQAPAEIDAALVAAIDAGTNPQIAPLADAGVGANATADAAREPPEGEVVATGFLSVTSKPPATIYVGGRSTGKRTPQRAIELAEGRHRVTLVNRDLAIRESFSVTIRPGKTTRAVKDFRDRIKPKVSKPESGCDEVSCLVEPDKACCRKWKEANHSKPPPADATGTLMIGAKPPCKIFIDGRDTGKTTPQRSMRLKVGRHRVTLVNNELGVRDSFAVTIRANERARVIKDLTSQLNK